MSGSGMIPARPEGLEVDFHGQTEGCVSAWSDDSTVRLIDEDGITRIRERRSAEIALGIICLAAARCTEVQALADSGRIERDGADLFIRRYSESIADIVALIAPAAPKQKGN
ncbi:MAG: hypothetical protein ACK4ZW_05800 [Blastomonas sp.]